MSLLLAMALAIVAAIAPPSDEASGQIDAQWVPGRDALWYVTGAPAETVVHVVDCASGETDPLFDVERVRELLAGQLGHEPPYDGLPFETVQFLDQNRVQFSVEERGFVFDLAKDTLTPAGGSSDDERGKPKVAREGFYAGEEDVYEVKSPDGLWLVTVDDHNLQLRSVRDGRASALTDDGTEDDAWLVDGATWSPDSNRVIVTRVDTTGVDRLPVVHWLNEVEDVEWTPYTKAGRRMPHARWFSIDIRTREIVELDGAGLRDWRTFPLRWDEDGRELFFLRISRTMQRLDLLACDPRIGTAREVLSESSDTFIEGLRFGAIQPSLMTPLGDGERFVWFAQRGGWNHLSLYDSGGELVAPLTRGDFEVLDVARIDEDAGFVYFHAHAEDHPYATHLYRVDLTGGQFQRLTDGALQHRGQLSPSGKYFLDHSSSFDVPPQTDLYAADGTHVATLGAANVEAMNASALARPEEFVVLAADNRTELYGLLFKPKDLDETRKYPVIDSIYGGPFTTWVPRTYTDGRAMQAQALTAQGFVVMMVDARGTPERGKAFQDVAYLDFGGHEIPDHAAALRQLAESRPWMDLDRVGIFGGSWGGYMTTRALVTHPEVYHVGVATNPVYDLHDHAASAIEPYMGLPQDHPEEYRAASSLLLADQLQGKLLLIHGTSDVNATFSATMKMTHALIQADKEFDLLVVPDQDHWFQGQAGAYSQKAQARYFREHLRPDDVVPVEQN